MSITVRTLESHTFEIEMQPHTSIRECKKLAEGKLGIPWWQQLWSIRGDAAYLKDFESLDCCGVTNGSEVTCLIQGEGGDRYVDRQEALESIFCTLKRNPTNGLWHCPFEESHFIG
jgi:hypothetical protein